MIDLSLTDAQREVQRTARAFAEREILPRIADLDSTATYDRSLFEKMGAEGFLGLPIPERYGGAGMDYIAFALLCEEMERADTAFRVVLLGPHRAQLADPAPVGERGPEAALPGSAGPGREAGHVRAHRARGRLGRGKPGDHRAPRR